MECLPKKSGRCGEVAVSGCSILSLQYFSFKSCSGPHQAEMSGVDDKVVTVNKLLEGNYVFKLTVTDDKGLTGSDTVAVNVKKGTLRSTQ